MAKRCIVTGHGPALPFSPVVQAGGYLFVSGQPGFEDPRTGREITGIEAQTRQCLENVKEVLRAAGSDLTSVVKVNVYLRNAEDFGKMNDVYRTYFPKEQPARTTVVTGFVMPNMLVEVDCIAYSP